MSTYPFIFHFKSIKSFCYKFTKKSERFPKVSKNTSDQIETFKNKKQWQKTTDLYIINYTFVVWRRKMFINNQLYSKMTVENDDFRMRTLIRVGFLYQPIRAPNFSTCWGALGVVRAVSAVHRKDSSRAKSPAENQTPKPQSQFRKQSYIEIITPRYFPDFTVSLTITTLLK